MSTAPHLLSVMNGGADCGWQAGFLAVLPSIRTHAEIQFRRLPPERREDSVQEAVASACASYHGLAVAGRRHVAYAGSLAAFAVKHVRRGRHVGGSQDGALDAMSAVAQRRHGFTTSSYDSRDRETGGWEQMAVAGRRTSVPDLAAFRIDFARWLRTLTDRDSRIIAALTEGEGSLAVASRFGISAARVSQLRRRYERAWRVFQGELTQG
jgi:hypothetical protein